MPQFNKDRRREPRALTAALIEIVDEYHDVSTCVLESLSSSGTSIHSDVPFRVGSQVIVKADSVAHNGVVRYCKPVPKAFSIGIEFLEEPWPKPIGLPIHWIPPVRS